MELVPLMRTRLLDQPCERPLLLVPPRAKRRRPNVGFETENLLHLDDKAVIPVLLYLFRRIEHRLDGWPDPGPAGRGLVIPSARTLLMTVVSCTSLQASLTFAIGRVVMANALCFQRAEAQGLHYIFIGGKDSLGSAAMRGGGWFGSVSLS